jgi:CRP/FNR family transcriptional regulator, cyclic AMP receptor protein
MDDSEFLSRVALFSLVKRRDLKRIAKTAKHHWYDKGEPIVREGDRDGRLFVVVSGEVAVVKDRGGPSERVLRTLRSGDYFGEMALIDDYVRTASVVANSRTEALSLDQWNLREEIRKYPVIAVELLQILGRRLRAAEQ